MRKKTFTIRITPETKKKFDGVRGEASSDKFLAYLIEFFLTKK